MKDYIGKKIQANYFRGIEAVGGHIYFDKTGLTFSSHKLNVQTGEARIEYKDINSVTKRNTLGIVPNGISILTNDNFEHKFVSYKRKLIIEFLEHMQRQASNL
ncbi:hypothetical protein [Clostridium sp. CCUG 7971]|uniref:hypothetical protein n=1 Tax=Clostridium sp. CCUG 7971 TaxID=2811414 RepID=UPI001ABB6D31|nr:hypothetical protein [Clostridium sp. CCUG 7971]MBO3444358.1 hypothetical protein [Clostridium sp. CCUG 7971]